MASSLDLLILPLARAGGVEQASVPGLYVSITPKRPARFRDRDRLALHLILEGNAPLSSDQIDALLENLAKTFYSTPGTVTTAQRAIAEALNQFLLDRNLRNASTGQQSVGHLTQIVFREDRLSVAQSGLSHAFLITESGTDHVYDLSLAGNGLGLSRKTPIRHSQILLEANDAAVIALQPPQAWTGESLMTFRGQGPESLRRRLLSLASAELNAFLLQAQPGNGQLRLLRPVKTVTPVPSGASTPAKADVEPEHSVIPQEADTPEMVTLPPTSQLSDEKQGVQGIELPAIEEPPIKSTQTPLDSPESDKAVAAPATFTAWFNKIGLASAIAAQRLLNGIGEIARRVLPDSSLFRIPSSTMAIVALGVPLIVVAVAAMVYFQRGRAEQYDSFFIQALEAASEAGTKIEPQELRQAWGATLTYLDQAESYQTTEESRQLREQAQGVLDNLDVIERLEFKPAIVGGLPEGASITRLVAVEDDLFLLNGTDGIVLHAIFTSDGYRLDPTFQCGPGPTSGLIVGALVDIAPASEEDVLNASILGIDANGNLLKCLIGESPVATPLQPPDINWGTPRAITVDGNDLYVLDPQTNAVWVYSEMNITDAPRLYFDEQIPIMQDTIDLAVNTGDLYLLHEDGHLTTCVFSALATSPTRCQEPAVFTDPRPGRQSGPFIEDATFSEIKFSPPPEPSLYLLDPNTKSIYHFSVRLTYDRQYRSTEPLPEGPATAFAVEKVNRIAFLAQSDQVFYAAMP